MSLEDVLGGVLGLRYLDTHALRGRGVIAQGWGARCMRCMRSTKDIIEESLSEDAVSSAHPHEHRCGSRTAAIAYAGCGDTYKID